MATISSLANTQQTTTVATPRADGVGSTGGTNIQPNQSVDNTAALIQDIGKMFGGIIQTHQEASAYAGKRVGTDNLVSYAERMSMIAQKYKDKPNLTSMDMTNKSYEEQQVYKEYLEKGTFSNNDIANQAFKDTYASPAGNFLLSTIETNKALKTKLFTQETVLAVQNEMVATSSLATQENINVWKERLASVGVYDYTNLYASLADSLNSGFTDKYKDGIDSPSLLTYAPKGSLTQQHLDALFNKEFGNFARREDGVYTKLDPAMTDTAYESIKKNFDNWLDGYNYQKEETTKHINTNVSNGSNPIYARPEQLEKEMKNNFKQIREVYAMNPNQNLTDAIDKAIKQASNVEISKIVWKISDNIFANKLNYRTALGRKYETNIVYAEIAPDITQTIDSVVLTPQQINEHLDYVTPKHIYTALESGNIQNAETTGKAVGKMIADGFTGSGTLNAVSNYNKNLIQDGGQNSSSSLNLLATVDFTLAVNLAQGMPNASWVNKNNVRDLHYTYRNLKEQQKKDSKITDNYIFLKLKEKSNALATGSKMPVIKEPHRVTSSDYINKTNKMAPTDLIAGMVIGNIDLHGSSNALDNLAYNSANPPRNKEEYEAFAKEKLMILENTPIHYWTRTAIISPLPISTENNDKVRANLQKLINYDLQNSKSSYKINISSFTKDGNNRIHQFKALDGTISSQITLYDKGKVVFSQTYTAYEIASGNRASMQQKRGKK